MITPEYQPSLPPESGCAHGTDAWTLCEPCLAEIIDGNAVLGRFDLMDISGGLAVDLHDDGEVAIYMLHAFNVAYGGGGVSYAWVTHDERLTTEPDVVIARPTDPVVIATQEIADFCELASGLATALRPVVESATARDDADAFVEGIDEWLHRHGAKSRTRRFVLWVLLMLVLAMMNRDGDGDR
ncbi:hypothetical protein [Microbacterium paraoxydans]|uniref:hypothetical protein n=1 Tax=Microbacterium paraoxydans TaxID=199592 RepID=UPI0011AAE359|nr:hypothetical protein [Microbacterium paraoxydans]